MFGFTEALDLIKKGEMRLRLTIPFRFRSLRDIINYAGQRVCYHEKQLEDKGVGVKTSLKGLVFLKGGLLELTYSLLIGREEDPYWSFPICEPR